MPEGDSVHRHAAQLAPLLDVVEAVYQRGLRVAALDGARVLSVEPRGKHLLVTLDRRAVVHVHLGINGGWRVRPRAEVSQEMVGRADLALLTPTHALLARARTVEVLQQAFARAHPALRTLGQDLLGEEIDLAEIVARARTRGAGRPIGELLLDQKVAAGIGNIFRNEVLFAERVHPRVTADSLDDATLERLYRRARDLLRASVARGRMPKNVYRRRRHPCPRCGAAIEGAMDGNQRQLFWCPRCQPAA